MEIVLHIESKNYAKVREALLKDQVVSLATVKFKDAQSLGGKDGYFCYVSGLDAQCAKALELSKDLAKEVEKKESEEIIKKIKDEEQSATEALGGLFG